MVFRSPPTGSRLVSHRARPKRLPTGSCGSGWSGGIGCRAITTSAPSARTRSTGTGFTIAPSISARPSRMMGRKMFGMVKLGWMPSRTGPASITTSVPVPMSVAIATNGA